MTSPGRYRNEPADIVEEINRLKRRVDALEQNPRAGNTTIDTGTFRVKDATGNVRVQVGLLSDGTYGMEVLEDGASVFHQVPYVYTDQIMTAETCSSTTYTDLTTVGPTVTVPVRSSGRILVITTCQINLSGSFLTSNASFANGRAAFSMSGANTSSASDTDKLLVYLDTDVEVPGGGFIFSRSQGSLTGQAIIDGLNSGSTTLQLKYRKSATGGATNPEFARRTLTVITL